MTFFEDQRKARKKTLLLGGLLALAVLGIVIAVYFAVVLAFHAAFEGTLEPTSNYWYPEVFFLTSIIVLCVVALGSLYKIYTLRSGGKVVATSLGGQLISPNTTDPQERKLLNVVEEVAIASGTAVPPVYLLPQEEGINAFAAGHTISNAVIGVTRGCMELLTREELQGVIAHEFSHVINGDMRMNLRLLGIAHGILVIGVTGYWIFRISARSSSRRSRNNSNNGGQAGLFIFGLTLYVVGYIGVFFGRVIKAAISRQREFLADASAVQFTRTPHGISGALQKIGGLTQGSRLHSDNAESASHMFFANGIQSMFFQVLATHPPLKQRIKRIDPHFTEFKSIDYDVMAQHSAAQESGSNKSTGNTMGFSSVSSSGAVAVTPDELANSVGAPQSQHLEFAQQLLASLPAAVTAEAHEPFGARAIIYLLLLDQQQEIRTEQLQILSDTEESTTLTLVSQLEHLVLTLPQEARLPLVDLCIPALRLLSNDQYSDFRSNLNALAGADGACSLFEYCLHFVLLRHVESSFTTRRSAFRKPSRIAIESASLNVLRILAIAGHDDIDQRKAAFERGTQLLQTALHGEASLEGEPSLDELDKSLKVLIEANPALLRPLITSATACITSDGKISVDEAELLRTICDALECPLPPILNAA